RATGALAALLGCAALYAQWRVLPLMRVQAAIVVPAVREAFFAQALLLIALFTAGSYAKPPFSSAGCRLRWVALSYGLFNLGSQILYRFSGLPREYYFFKYSLHAVVLEVFAVLVLFAWKTASVLSDWKQGSPGATAVSAAHIASVCASALLFGNAYAAYRESLAERAHGKPPWHLIGPLADLNGWSRVESITRTAGKKFGGLVSPSWPLSNFMNAGLGAWLQDSDERWSTI